MTYSVYVVTDSVVSGRSHEDVAGQAYAGGADVVQLRDKDMCASDLLETAKRMKAISVHYDRLFIVNDRVDVALASGADGVHIGQSDLPCRVVRDMVPEGFLIGVSVSNVTEAVNAERDGADYVVLSPIFATSTKADAGEGGGIEVLKGMRRVVSIPLLAIGGITMENAKETIEAGADGVAVVSAVISKELNIPESVRDMRTVVREAKLRAL